MRPAADRGCALSRKAVAHRINEFNIINIIWAHDASENEAKTKRKKRAGLPG